MSNEKPKKPKLKGFAAFIETIINSVKGKEEYKEAIRGEKTRVLLQNEENKWAALITLENGEITVEGIKTEPKENLSRKKLYWWGFWRFPTLQTMMGAGSWGTGKWLRKMAGGKVKGASQVAIIGKILALAAPPTKSGKDK
ncbi:MAG: hypothetical protein EU529_16035 [Promethearchaeota archaeon]|nr:MAG: hypothetical protein EU529_16035 [Candidatus Lokiarchaeota archaeon]